MEINTTEKYGENLKRNANLLKKWRIYINTKTICNKKENNKENSFIGCVLHHLFNISRGSSFLGFPTLSILYLLNTYGYNFHIDNPSNEKQNLNYKWNIN